MKVKDIVAEAGFWTGVKQALTPDKLRRQPADLSKAQANDLAKKLYGSNEDDWLTADEIAAKNTPASAPSATPITHPDVSIISSYPLRMRYKNGDFVLNPTTNQWMTVGGKKVAPELASFLQFQAGKL